MHIRVSRLKKCAHDRDSGYHPQSGYDNETAPSDDQHHPARDAVRPGRHTGHLRQGLRRPCGVRGYAVILDQPDGFWLDNIAVDPAAQGQGIGGRLLAAVESWLRQRTGRYSLYTHVRMTANIAWYGRAGFTETGRRRVNRFDRVYFEKHFSQPEDK